MKKIISILLCAVLLSTLFMVFTVPAFAEDYTTVKNGSELQALIDAADSGDTLYVKLDYTSEPYYFVMEETININKTLTIYFENGTAKGELITPYCKHGKGRCFLVSADNVKLHFGSNILIYGNLNNAPGEGIYVDGDNCLIDGANFWRCGQYWYSEDGIDYFTEYDGGTIYVNGENCTIQNCSFEESYGVDGGAICVDKDDCHIENCTFKDCIAGDDGGAIYVCYNTDGVRIDNCTFENCSCKGKGQYVSGDGANPNNENDTWVYNCSEPFGDTKYYYDCACVFTGSGFTLSSGNTWIIIAGVVVAVIAIAVVVAKKKKKATE